MITHCKFCLNNIPIPQLGNSWWCNQCQVYSFVCTDDDVVESESLRSHNIYLIYIPSSKEGKISMMDPSNNHLLMRDLYFFTMNELTHQQVVEWVERLKIFAIFQ